MDISIKDEKKILAELKKQKGNVSLAAKILGVPKETIMKLQIIDQQMFNYTSVGLGPQHLHKYLVARRSVLATGGWDNKQPEIAKARKDYDAGLIEMATGRDGEFLLLYAIPRRVRAARFRQYFRPEKYK